MKIFYAFTHFGLTGYQRDYIYYNQTPTQLDGSFDRRFRESVVGLEFKGDPQIALDLISGDGDEDPKAPASIPGHGRSRGGETAKIWTDGHFDFKITAYVGGGTSPIPEGSSVFISVNPDDIFDIDYGANRSSDGSVDANTYYIQSIKLKRLVLNRPLYDWDLSKYSPTAKYVLSEIDHGQVTTTQTTQTIKMASNVSLTGKIGLGISLSSEESITNTFTVQKTDKDDILCEFLVNYSDPVILSNQMDSIENFTIVDSTNIKFVSNDDFSAYSGSRPSYSGTDSNTRPSGNDNTRPSISSTHSNSDPVRPTNSGGVAYSPDYLYIPKYYNIYGSNIVTVYISPIQTF